MRFDPRRTLFYVSRHGETGPFDEKLVGPVNPPLSAKGHQSANDLASFFQNLPLAGIVSSPMNRALETAMVVGETKNLTPHIDKRIASWYMGHIPSLPVEPPPSLIDHYVDHPDIKIPGGESLNQFRQRVHPVFGEAIKAFQHLKIPSLLSVHDSVVREAGAVFNKDLESALVKPGGVVAVMRHRSGVIRAVPVFKQDKLSSSKIEDGK
jgi:broad specificity phosphatase PhoE